MGMARSRVPLVDLCIGLGFYSLGDLCCEHALARMERSAPGEPYESPAEETRERSIHAPVSEHLLLAVLKEPS